MSTKRLNIEKFPLRYFAFVSQISRKVAETQSIERMKVNEKHSTIHLFSKMELVADSHKIKPQNDTQYRKS
ncbi:hypothetical protein [Flavobacterium sp. TSSA_36]|uniref:hypothetical protein n=1 Tax=Flavobacterium sp. TSSA_36 TaxID=3447669 RepID=UPI003F5D7D60